MHGLQIWVALPKALEQSEPSFAHISAEDIPRWEQEGLHFKLIAGEAFGRQSPVPVHSPLYFIEIKSTAAAQLDIGHGLFGESALYILEGHIRSDGNTYEPQQILVAKDSTLCAFEIGADTIVYIFGGEPFPEERFIHWNFVNSDRAVIEQAKWDWLEQRFPPVPGETEFVPLPAHSLKPGG
jgi:redox-sensitive bicupin YhaK (pirin superfamily)